MNAALLVRLAMAAFIHSDDKRGSALKHCVALKGLRGTKIQDQRLFEWGV